jgi:alkanesulfonate monooxygenase SsuD/methylene tetrahydromethanopterin reductase-like flavin-dependent oxidoreductase (luciferase family)
LTIKDELAVLPAQSATAESRFRADVRGAQHHSKHFRSTGPFTTEQSIHCTPFIFQADASSAGKALATKHADCMFLPGMEPATVRRSVDDIRVRAAAAHGRNLATPRLIAGILIVVAETYAPSTMSTSRTPTSRAHARPLWRLDGRVDLARWGGDDDDFRFTGPGAVQSLVST